jgi:hypothetical protein
LLLRLATFNGVLQWVVDLVPAHSWSYAVSGDMLAGENLTDWRKGLACLLDETNAVYRAGKEDREV